MQLFLCRLTLALQWFRFRSGKLADNRTHSTHGEKRITPRDFLPGFAIPTIMHTSLDCRYSSALPLFLWLSVTGRSNAGPRPYIQDTAKASPSQSISIHRSSAFGFSLARSRRSTIAKQFLSFWRNGSQAWTQYTERGTTKDFRRTKVYI